ncbi:MAG: hypothetical protein FD187_3241, partial [bacterium]
MGEPGLGSRAGGAPQGRVGVGHASGWVGVWVGLVEPVGLGVGGVSLSLGVPASVGVGIPVRLLGVSSAGARGVGLPIGMLLEEPYLGFQAGYILGTSGEMELEEAVGDHHHAVAGEMVQGIAHGHGISHCAIGGGGDRMRGNLFGQLQERRERVSGPKAIGHPMEGAA